MSDIKRMIEILKFPDRHNFEALDSDDDDAPDAYEAVLSILEGHEAQAAATIEDLFKAYGFEDSIWPSDAVRETQDPNLPYVGDKPGLVVVPCQNTLKVDDDVE
jgi:hypothetical protein